MWVFCLHVGLCTMCMHGGLESWRKVSNLRVKLQTAVSPHVGPLEKQPVTLATVPLLQPHDVENVQMQKVKVNAVVVSTTPVLLMSCEDSTEFSRSFTAQ